MIGNLNNLVKDTLEQMYEFFEPQDLIYYDYLNQYCVKDGLRRKAFSPEEKIKAWVFLTQYGSMSLQERYDFMSPLLIEGDVFASFKKVTSYYFDKFVEASDFMNEDTTYSWVKFIKDDTVSHDPSVRILVINTEYVRKSAIFDMENLTTIFIEDGAKTIPETIAVRCPKLTRIFVPASCPECDLKENVIVYGGDTSVYTPVSTTNTEELNKLQVEIDDLREKLSKSASVNEELTEKLKEVETLKAELKESKKREEVAIQAAEAAKPTVDIDAVQVELSDTRRQLESAWATASSYKENIDSLSEEVSDLKEKLTAKEESYSAIEKIKTENTTMKETVESLTREKDAISAQLESVRKTVEDIETVRVELDKAIKARSKAMLELSTIRSEQTAKQQRMLQYADVDTEESLTEKAKEIMASVGLSGSNDVSFNAGICVLGKVLSQKFASVKTEHNKLRDSYDQLNEKYKKLSALNSSYTSEIATLTSKLQEYESNDKKLTDSDILDSITFLGIDSMQMLSQVAETIVDKYNILVPDAYTSDALAMACIALMGKEYSILETKYETMQEDGLDLTHFPALSNYYTSIELCNLLQAHGIDTSSIPTVEEYLRREEDIALTYMLNQADIKEFGLMLPSEYKKAKGAVSNTKELTQLDYVRAMAVLKSIAEQGNMPTSGLDELVKLAKVNRKTNTNKDKILKVMAKYGETDYDEVYNYVITNGDQMIFSHYHKDNRDEEFVADCAEEVLSKKHANVTVAEPRKSISAGPTYEEILDAIAKTYSLTNSEDVLSKYDELKQRVGSEKSELLTNTIIMEMIKIDEDPFPTTKRKRRTKAQIALQEVLDTYQSELTPEELIQEMQDKSLLPKTHKNDYAIWDADAFLFYSQGLKLKDPDKTELDDKYLKRALFITYPTLDSVTRKNMYEELIEKYSSIADEQSRYKSVLAEITRTEVNDSEEN